MKQNRKVSSEPVDGVEEWPNQEPPLPPADRTLPQGDAPGIPLALPAKGKTGQQQNHNDPDGPLITRNGKLWMIGIAIVLVLALLIGFIPRHHRNKKIEEEAERKKNTPPTVETVQAQRSSTDDHLELPGTLNAFIEAPIFARATGYVRIRQADIGDKVRPGQLLAIIDAPDLDRQVDQGRATLLQSQSAVGQVQAQLNLALLTRDRFSVLVNKGVIARQDFDTQQANYEVAVANVSAAQNTVAANKANLDRLLKLQQYERVIAPFAGVVTARNVDVGSLISATGSGQGDAANTAGSTNNASPSTGGAQGGEMFRIAQADRLRVFVAVPEAYASYVQRGMAADIEASSRPGYKAKGIVTRTADTVDPNTRTLLTEIQIENLKQELMPGMYVLVSLVNVRAQPPLSVPSDSVITRSNGNLIAVVKGNTIHLQPIQLGRDYGPMVEVISGLNEGDQVVLTPNDASTEGAKINPKLTQPPSQQNATGKQQSNAGGEGYEKSQSTGTPQNGGQNSGDQKNGDQKGGDQNGGSKGQQKNQSGKQK
jgi:multidrug efflux pump subunit AcrA (membrane-fusion protein)